ncbi:MAG: Mo-dependent nitrogenase C-terminal domain-containing protein [Waterburya sp.]
MIKTLIQNRNQKSLNPWQDLQQWLEELEIKEEQTARRIVKLIPAQCPFEREIKIFGQVIFRIPALCKLNPLYEQLVTLRFRALCFLVDSCGEDITPYVC